MVKSDIESHLAACELAPQEKMGRNDPCWCRSGRKWKNCHLDRERQRPRNINEILGTIRLEQAKGYCAHPDASKGTCSGGPTDAHTIQKEGGLRTIAENGKVLSVKKGAFGIAKNQGEIVPVAEGIGNASTFPGFCNAHDAIFGPAEQKTAPLNQEVAFLLSYRAVVYEKFLKEAALRSIDYSRLEADKGLLFAEQVRVQQLLARMKYFSELGLRDMGRCKAAFDGAYRAAYAGFDFRAVEFSTVLPVVSCGAFYPDFDFLGQRLQSLAAKTALEPIAVNLTVFNGRTVFILGWLGSGGPAEAFASSYLRLPEAELANAAVRLALEYSENTYVRPTWWNNLPEMDRDCVAASFYTLDASTVSQREATGLCRDGRVLASAAVTRVAP